MSEAAVSLAFFDPARQLSGTARAGLTLVFEGKTPTTLPEQAELAPAGEGWTARSGERLLLEFNPVSVAARLDGSSIRLCRVGGSVNGTRVDCLGTITEVESAPPWSELDALRSISALFDDETAIFALAERRRGARSHGEEHVIATLLRGGELMPVEEARLSTVYDGDGRQRTAGLELWLPEEDFPRRASGSAEAGASLSFEGLRVNVAVFHWRMEGRDGRGAYELTLREEHEAA